MWAGWAGGGAWVWRVSMAWEDRMRAAWKAARKWAFRVATAWEEVRLRLAREEEVAKMESMKCQMVAGPMPPKVVMTHGRKRRPRAAEPIYGPAARDGRM